MRCARCQNLWFAGAPPIVPALADEAAAEPEVSEGAPEENLDAVAAEEAAAPVEAQNLPPEPASTDGIDLRGLSADIEVERAEQTAAPALVPPMEPGREPDAAIGTPDAVVRADIETFSARRARAETRRHRRWPVPGLPAFIFVLVAANAILVGWRTDVVRLLPQTASLYAAVGIPVNLRGLDFENIKISKEMHDGVPVLVVEGSIVNVAAHAVEVPRLRLAVRNEGGNDIYTWTTLPTRSILGSAETLPFRSRLASPPAEAKDVLVRFFSKRDVVAGLN